MKKSEVKIAVLLIFLEVLISSCSSDKIVLDKNLIGLNEVNRNKIGNTIQSFLKGTLKSKYEFIPERGIIKFDSAFSILIDDSLKIKHKLYKTYLDSFDILMKNMDDDIPKSYSIYKIDDKNIANDTILLHKYLDNIKSSSNNLINYVDNFNNNFIGWKVEYEFKLSNNKKLNTYFAYFVIDTSFSSILLFSDKTWDEDINLKLMRLEHNNHLVEKNIQLEVYRLIRDKN